MSGGKRRNIFKRFERTVEYWRELALTEFVTDLTRRMEERGLTRKTLADKLRLTRASVTQALRGDSNLGLASLVKYAMAVDGVVHIHIADRGVATTWIDRPVGEQATAGDEPMASSTRDIRYDEVAGSSFVVNLAASVGEEHGSDTLH